MATHKGESVAFTCGYAGNLIDIAKYIRLYAGESGKTTAPLAAELKDLIFADGTELFSSPSKKRELLMNYMDKVSHEVSGDKEEVSLEEIAKALETKAEFMMNQIRDKEWVTDSEGNGWFNGYYDDNGERVEGEFDTPDGKNIRMMLTGQVFSVMSGTAQEENVKEIIKSADKYLYKEGIGGYRLNTDFKALRTDLGRMFGFSYGDKENGAVFSHMAVMFGNALYKRGFAKEGFKALNTLYKASSNFEVSRIYPGVPEYFNAEGRGLYNYLTGAASWMMMTVVTQSFGVRGEAGDLVMQPALVAEQFDNSGNAAITLHFRGKEFEVRFINPDKKEFGDYQVTKALADGKEITVEAGKRAVLKAADIDALSDGKHVIEVYL